MSHPVGGWARRLDDLAGATAELLSHGAGNGQPLTDPPSTLAARDAVLQQLRQLVGAVGDAPRFAEVRELTLRDVVDQPAQALHRTLCALPRAVPFGAAELVGADVRTLPTYERAWQGAARAAIGLEVYIDVLRQLPDRPAWAVLRDLTDVAAALPYLDHDLSEALLSGLEPAHLLDGPYRMLTHPGHDALRIVAGEVRARVPASQRSGSDVGTPHGQQHAQPRSQPGSQATPRRPDGSPGEFADRAGGRSPAGHVDVVEAMVRYAHAVSAHGSHLSVADVKATRRLLQMGSVYAATVLERAVPALAGAVDVVHGLRATAESADALRDAPARSMTPPHVELVAASRDLLAEMAGLAGQAARLPGDAAQRDLHRLALPALGFAQQVPALAVALDLSVRQALAERLMLVPGTIDKQQTSTISWVTVTMRAHRDVPPAIAMGAGQLASTARRLAPALRHATDEFTRHSRSAPRSTQQAVLDARRHVGAARLELRQALAARTASHPSVLGAQLASHPRLSGQHPTGRQR